jgi:hypothetical protein
MVSELKVMKSNLDSINSPPFKLNIPYKFNHLIISLTLTLVWAQKGPNLLKWSLTYVLIASSSSSLIFIIFFQMGT